MVRGPRIPRSMNSLFIRNALSSTKFEIPAVSAEWLTREKSINFKFFDISSFLNITTRNMILKKTKITIIRHFRAIFRPLCILNFFCLLLEKKSFFLFSLLELGSHSTRHCQFHSRHHSISIGRP